MTFRVFPTYTNTSNGVSVISLCRWWGKGAWEPLQRGGERGKRRRGEDTGEGREG